MKEKLEKTEKQNEIQLKDLKKDYEASSKDLHLMTSRCDRLRDENNRLVDLPPPVRSRIFVTMSKDTFDEGAKLLASAQDVAGNSAFAVFRALYERRARTCSELAANLRKKDRFITNVYIISMQATESLLTEVWKEFTGMVDQKVMVKI